MRISNIWSLFGFLLSAEIILIFNKLSNYFARSFQSICCGRRKELKGLQHVVHNRWQQISTKVEISRFTLFSTFRIYFEKVLRTKSQISAHLVSWRWTTLRESSHRVQIIKSALNSHCNYSLTTTHTQLVLVQVQVP